MVANETLLLGAAALGGGYLLFRGPAEPEIDTRPQSAGGTLSCKQLADIEWAKRQDARWTYKTLPDGRRVKTDKTTGLTYLVLDSQMSLAEHGAWGVAPHCAIEQSKWSSLAKIADENGEFGKLIEGMTAREACEAMNATAKANPELFPGFAPKDCSKVENLEEAKEYIKAGFQVAAGMAGYLGGAAACTAVGGGAIIAKFCGAFGSLVSAYVAGYIWDGAEWVYDKLKFW